MDLASPEAIPISALEHWSYCRRQCALIHLESTFDDNVQTVRGHHAHERVHEEGQAARDGVRVVRGMSIWSDELGLVGKADAVEFHGDVPYPVEYKVGKRGPWQHAELQLAGQALCLEEMFRVRVERGAVYFRGSQRRREVEIDEPLRDALREAVREIRTMLSGGAMPAAVNDARCPRCSLVDACLPSVVGRPRRLQLLHTGLFRPEPWPDVNAE